jgi:hypothetical protein
MLCVMNMVTVIVVGAELGAHNKWKEWKYEGMSLKNNKKPKLIPHHTWVFFIFLDLFALY